jgi:hypothetical protein
MNLASSWTRWPGSGLLRALPAPVVGHPGPAEVPIDISEPRSRIINKCCNGYRSRSDPHRDLIPQARAALGWPPRLGPLALSCSPRAPTGRGVPPPRAAADHQGLVDRSQEGGWDPNALGRKLSLPTFVDQNSDAC